MKMARARILLTSIQYAFVSILVVLATTTTSDDTTLIPASKSTLNDWFTANVKPYAVRKGSLNATLEVAEANPKIIKVRKDGSGDFKTLTDAVKSIPKGNKQRVIVDIGPGVYTEKVKIDHDKPFVTFYGSPNAIPTLAFNGTAKEYGTVYSATLEVWSDFFVAANLIMKNTAPKPDGTNEQAQAVAFTILGDKAAIYNCKFHGFQDTLCDHNGRHFFKDCYVEGTVDFVFGNGKSIYLNSILHVVDNKYSAITAHARATPAEDTGFVFLHCDVTGDGTGAFLGRVWFEMPRVIFAYTKMGKVVNPVGWSTKDNPAREKTVFFAEYMSSGPGFTPQQRAKYSKQLTDEQMKPYQSLSYIEGSEWLLPPPKL